MFLECIPNLSAAHDAGTVDRLAAAVTSAPGVHLLDRSSDLDHNRSVFTLAGPSAALVNGMLALFEVAVAEIDLRRHDGVHPRIGAVDVVPFVPLGDTPMSAAVDAARHLGREVGQRFGMPVFLYDEAGNGRKLPAIRRGGVAGLAERIGSELSVPDFGPARLHPTAGATAIGARFFLVAFNVVLAGGDLGLAQRIARAVRESSGGLPAVRAIGVELASRGVVQVSMNLTDYRRTDVAGALAAVRAHAEAAGAGVLETEVIGLVPSAAARGADEVVAGRVLEDRLRAAAIEL